MSETTEHRRHPRAPADFSLLLDADNSCRVQDISASGVRCVTHTHLSPMTVVGLRLEIPVHMNGEDSWAEVSCKGVVVRSRPLQEDAGEGYEVAIFFQGLADREETAIASYVESTL
ncbi:MAG: PilZ domain-containing protein [Planctomycetota bacterium]